VSPDNCGRFGETVGLACRPPPELGAVLEGQLFVQYPECRIEMLPGKSSFFQANFVVPQQLWLSLFLRFRGLQPGIRRNSFSGKHLYEVVREAEIPPQLSATQGFRVILAN